jgi:hypothetical protein
VWVRSAYGELVKLMQHVFVVAVNDRKDESWDLINRMAELERVVFLVEPPGLAVALTEHFLSPSRSEGGS